MPEVHSLPHDASVTKIKKKIRDLERLHKKPGLNAEKRSETERALKTFKDQLVQQEAIQKKKKISGKYKMVRFFELKKATRKLKRESKTDKTSDAYQQALLDYLYIVHFPEDKKYLALYATDKPLQEALDFKHQLKNKLQQGDLDLSQVPK